LSVKVVGTNLNELVIPAHQSANPSVSSRKIYKLAAQGPKFASPPKTPPHQGVKQLPQVHLRLETPPHQGVKQLPRVAPLFGAPPHQGAKQSSSAPGPVEPPHQGVKQPSSAPVPVDPPHQGVKQLTPQAPPASRANESRRQQLEKWRAERADGSPRRYALTSPEPRRPVAEQRTFQSPFGVDPKSPNPRTEAGKERNRLRLAQANREDENTLGEPRKGYLPNNPASFLPEPVTGPDDSFLPPDWFLRELRRIADSPCPTPARPTIRFEVSQEAAQHNAQLLRQVDYDMTQFLGTQRGTTVDAGSEFRSVETLRPLLGGHPNFKELAQVLSTGMPYRYDRGIDEATREKEMLAMIVRGNHKSAQANPDQVGRLLTKDVVHGFSLVVPIELVPLIPDAMVQPTGLAEQWVLDSEGERKIKYRLTQDLTYAESEKDLPISVNSRIDMGAYPEMIYGWCLPRIIHFIVALRLASPGVAIFIAKYDYSDAYRRISHSATAVAQTITTLGTLAFLYLRLTFGGSPNPPTWCGFSEVVTDLANEISMCADWDPDTLKSPDQTVTPAPVRMTPDVPFGLAQPMAVIIPPVITGRVDGFIDDLINVFLDTVENCRRQPHVVPLAMFVTSRPHAGAETEPIQRRSILSLEKLLAEGAPAESQIVLGWRLDTRRLSVALPQDKFEAWSATLAQVVRAKGGTKAVLESLEGQLNHASYVIPLARHFLTRIRERKNSKTNKGSHIALGPEAVQDFILWQGFLAKAHAGISMNLIVARQPNRIVWSDSCPFGIGGFRLASGKAWRIQIPKESILYGSDRINNLLEFLGMAVNVWLECLDAPARSHLCLLALGDSTSAVGWVHNSSKLDTKLVAHAAHLMVARHVAQVVTEADCCLAAQHLRGELNFVADLLSFAGSRTRAGGKRHPIAFDDPPDDILTQRFHLYYPDQIPENFAICQLPSEVLSWVSSVLQTAALSLTAAKKEATKTTTAHGGDGWGSAKSQASALTPSSLLYPRSNGSCSAELSFPATEVLSGPPPEKLMESVKGQWSRALCGKPQATWLRRFGCISNQAPFTSRAPPSCTPLPVPSSRPLTMSTPLPPDNEPSRRSCCEACSD
jgi:hypothetical protein